MIGALLWLTAFAADQSVNSKSHTFVWKEGEQRRYELRLTTSGRFGDQRKNALSYACRTARI